MTLDRGEATDSAQCPMCPVGTLREGTTTLTMERGEATIVVKEVPADVCDICGEAFIDEDASEKVYEQTEAAVENGVKVNVRRFDLRRKTQDNR
jgi:YgiT-type zinc finger domain-containing protein